MDIQKNKIHSLVLNNKRIEIPFYQRDYSWSEKECIQLLNDILNFSLKEYYVGQIITKRRGHKLLIIDGQQRITTYIIILKSLVDCGYDKNKEIEKLIDNLDFESKNLADNHILSNLMKNIKNESESKYIKNFNSIIDWVNKNINDLNIQSFMEKIMNITCADIILDESADEFTIFSQINSTGKKLNCMDLIKNFIFSKINNNYSIEDFNKIVSSLLNKFDNCTKTLSNDESKRKFFRHYISYKTNNLPKLDDIDIFEKFKNVFYNFYGDEQSEQCFDDICKFSIIYTYIKDKKWEQNKNIKEIMMSLFDNVDTYMILLIRVFEATCTLSTDSFSIKINEENELKNSLLIIESYKFRRYFCDFKDKVITRFIPTIEFHLCDKMPIDYILYNSLYFKPNNSNKKFEYRMPTDDEFKSNMLNKNAYTSDKICKAFLMRLARHISKETWNESDFSIEHVLPQDHKKWEISDQDLKDVDFKKQTIGNLTLTVINPELSNEVFDKKKSILFNKDNFPLNKYFLDISEWNIEEIDKRTEWIYDLCKSIWDFNKYNDIKEKYSDYIQVNNVKQEKKQNDKNEENIKQIQYIKSQYKKAKSFTYDDICNVIKNYIVDGKSFSKCETEVFNVNLKGFLTQSIIRILEIPTSFKGEKDLIFFNNFIENNQEKINYILKLVS